MTLQGKGVGKTPVFPWRKAAKRRKTVGFRGCKRSLKPIFICRTGEAKVVDHSNLVSVDVTISVTFVTFCYSIIMKVLITGIAGTGKSTIVKALNERGIVSIDLHDVPGLFFWQNKETKEKVEYSPVQSKDWFDTVDRLCDITKLKEMLDQYTGIVMAGTSGGGSNQKEFLSLFDKVILLQSSPETLIHRMKTRTNKSGYGKTEAEQEDNLEWRKEFDPQILSYGAIPVSTEGTIDNVIQKIIEIIKV